MSHEPQLNWAAAIVAQCGIVPLVEGPPGVAKTAAFRQLATRLDRRFVQLLLSQRLPEDLGGLPVAQDVSIGGAARRVVRHLLPEELAVAHAEPSLILLDELNQADRAVLGAAQEWINSPPASCIMVACQNQAEQSTAGRGLSPPVINRMIRLAWDVPVDAILSGWERDESYPDLRLPIVPPRDEWQPSRLYWGGLAAAFWRANPGALTDAVPKHARTNCPPWCSPRSLRNAWLSLAACDAVGADTDTRHAIVRGAIGEGASISWWAWVRAQDLPDPRAILDDPNSLHLPMEFDRAKAVLGAVIGLIQRCPDRWESAREVVCVAYGQQQEIALAAVGPLWKQQPAGYRPRPGGRVWAEIESTLAHTGRDRT